MLRAYVELHRRGYAHSIETWRGGQLVGGLYGVRLGGVFFGESMFSRERDASKVALARLVEACRAERHRGDRLPDGLAPTCEAWAAGAFRARASRRCCGNTCLPAAPPSAGAHPTALRQIALAGAFMQNSRPLGPHGQYV